MVSNTAHRFVSTENTKAVIVLVVPLTMCKKQQVLATE